jgi:hypothetical protein
MIVGWLLILILVFISLSLLFRGALHFNNSGLDISNPCFPYVFALFGITAFIIPIFINRAVCGLDALCFSERLREDTEDIDNRTYWERRFTVETMQKLYERPKYAGTWLFAESLALVSVLSFAVSGFYPPIFYIIAPLVALFLALFLHWPWPSKINVDEAKLPPALKKKRSE